MDFILAAVDYILHLDRHMDGLWQQYGLWLYAIVFAIVFAETGLVVTPWLPGDSLLFVLGALAAVGGPNVYVLIVILFAAAVLGNTSNYWIGRWIGPRVFHFPDSVFFSRATLEKAHGFYERHGAITVMASRFLPLIRTFAPFVAGVGAMSHSKFQFYSILGGGLWVLCFVLAGYFFGQIPIVKNNLPLVIVGVIFVSFVPLIVEYLRSKMAKKG